YPGAAADSLGSAALAAEPQAVSRLGGESPLLRKYGLWTILVHDVPTIVEGDFEWDSAKAESNIRKHGVSFFEAATVFADPFAVYLDDGSDIGTLVVIGTSLRERVLYVVHVQRATRDRIISARPDEQGERAVYESGGTS